MRCRSLPARWGRPPFFVLRETPASLAREAGALIMTRNFFSGVTTFVVCLLLAAGSSETQAKVKSTELEPNTNWNVDFADERCRLTRTFGKGRDEHALIIEQRGPSSTFAMTVAGRLLGRFKNGSPSRLQFSADEKAYEVSGLKGEMPIFGPSAIFSSVVISTDLSARPAVEQASDISPKVTRGIPTLALEKPSRTDFIAIEQHGRRIVLKTGELASAFKVMNSCTESLVREWGFDIETQRSVVSGPTIPDVAKLAKNLAETYTGEALSRGEQGVMSLRLTVETDGSASECIVGNLTKNRSLKTQVCKFVRAIDLEPARGDDGNPMRSFYLTQIVYRMSN